MNERKSLISWIEEHKNELIIAGVSIGVLVLVVLGIKNRKELQAIWDSLRKVTKQPIIEAAKTANNVTVEVPPESFEEIIIAAVPSSDTIPFEVRGHIRTLPTGWHASPAKVAEALENGINLMDGQTLVDTYLKGGAAA